ncbi:ArgS-related anticodon-binding protein NrtL [Streptomyces meridianus]|uniref:arginine--tRNA ligase n=1 Tax=Streptomyces meridianus TaxID=2938945 RepID=A0ABT0X8T7_9ACTN|nr:DALR anticodon-binding domain-containing protein [Streptomyces meridianus]MCM2578179.1 DALR anticodon-binding domain-containing protein [Streptomyces meridianus]
MTPAELSRTVLATVHRAVEAGELSAPLPTSVKVEQPRRPGCGDYATGIALQLAGPAARPPRTVAEILRARLAAEPGIAGVEIAGPGFLNISLDAGAHSGLLATVLAPGRAYGHGDDLAGTAVELRYPDETRAAVTADVLARILAALGADVTTSGPDRPDPAWAALLGVRPPDGAAAAEAPVRTVPSRPARHRESVRIRPVPVRLTGSYDGPARPGDDSHAVHSNHPGIAALLVDRLGSDAVRWALLRPAAHDHPRITDDLLVQRESNSLFRVRYAHARARALVRNAADLGVPPEPAATGDPAAGRTEGPAVTALLGALAEYPTVLRSAARHRASDRLARHLVVLADAFFRFHDTCAVLPRGEEKPEAAHRVRTALAQGTGTVLAGGLHLLGITAPDML